MQRIFQRDKFNRREEKEIEFRQGVPRYIYIVDIYSGQEHPVQYIYIHWTGCPQIYINWTGCLEIYIIYTGHGVPRYI